MTGEERDALVREGTALREQIARGVAEGREHQGLRTRYEEIRLTLAGGAAAKARPVAVALLREAGKHLQALESGAPAEALSPHVGALLDVRSAQRVEGNQPVPLQDDAAAAPAEAQPVPSLVHRRHRVLRLLPGTFRLIAVLCLLGAGGLGYLGVTTERPGYGLGALAAALAALYHLAGAAVVSLVLRSAGETGGAPGGGKAAS